MADEPENSAATIGRDGEISEDALNEELDKIEAKGESSDNRSEPTERASAEAGAEDAPEQPETTPEVVPPEHWSAEDKEAFLAMDDRSREVLKRFDTNATKGIEERSLKLKQWDEAIQPYQHLLAGSEPVQAVQRLLQAQAYLTQNPVEGIKWLMQSYGVEDKFKDSTQQAQVDDDPYLDPEVKRLRQELQSTKDEQAQRERQAQQQQQQRQMAMIQQFKSETDEAGNPKHPHFDELQPIIAGLLSSGRAQDLEQAYSEAQKAHPEYIEKEVQRRFEEQKAAEVERLAKEAEKAAEASKGPKGKVDAKAVKGKGSWQDDLESNFEKSERGEL